MLNSKIKQLRKTENIKCLYIHVILAPGFQIIVRLVTKLQGLATLC